MIGFITAILIKLTCPLTKKRYFKRLILPFNISGKNWKYIFCISLLCLLFNIGKAQQSSWAMPDFNNSIEPNLHIGRIIKHTWKFKPNITENSTVYALSFAHRTSPAKGRLWHALWGYPEWSVTAAYTKYGNGNIFGTAVGLLPALHFSIIKNKHLNWQFRFGAGLNYITKKFDIANNPTNNVIGSHINNYTLIGTSLEWRLGQKWSVLGHFSFSHSSNGRTSSPNLGINLPSAGLGLRFYLWQPTQSTSTPIDVTDSIKQAYKIPFLKRPLRRWQLGVRFGHGFTSGAVPGGPKFSVWMFAPYLQKRLTAKGQIMVGVESSYYTGIYHYAVFQAAWPAPQWKSAVKVAPYAAYELIFGNMGIVAVTGFYIYDVFFKRETLFNKLGLQYHAKNRLPKTHQPRQKNNLYGGIYLKTHYGNAEMVEIAIGCAF